MYQSLYQDGGSRWVPLSTAIERTLKEPRNNSDGVRFSVSADPGEVAARPAVAIGIVVNELVTNCLKHVLPQSSERGITVSVEAKRGRRDTLLITVRDDGSGFPKAVLAGERKGLGLEMVASLAEQYDGTLELSNDLGGVARVTLHVSWRPEEPSA
jgi:two-component sensor histidine kinase